MKNRFPPRKILAAVDGSQPSFAALKAARTLASHFGSRLEALYVDSILPLPQLEPALKSLEREKRALREEIEKYVVTVLSGFAADRRALRVVTAQPAAELVRLAGPRTADLVVMGTHGRQGGERFLMGSTAEAVFHRARVPVLAIREGHGLSLREILTPCNLEPYADEALLYALEFARAFGARLTALFVGGRKERNADADRLLKEHIERVFGARAASEVRRLVRWGDAREQIGVEAENGRYDLVVLSSHRRDQLSDLALGTTAERLLRRCSVPLLAVPASAPEKAPAAGTARLAPKPALD